MTVLLSQVTKLLKIVEKRSDIHSNQGGSINSIGTESIGPKRSISANLLLNGTLQGVTGGSPPRPNSSGGPGNNDPREVEGSGEDESINTLQTIQMS